MLTAKQGEFDQTEALDTGADDFLSKPFSYPVLLARLRALIRRGGSSQGAVLAHGDIRLDTREHRCWRGDEEVSLTAREFALLDYLLHREGEPVSKAELLQHVWDPSDERDANVVEVYIGYLRRKLDRPGEPSHIDTVRSAGYRLSGPNAGPVGPDGRWLRRIRQLFSGVRLRVTAAAVLAVACAFGVSAAVVEVTLQHDRHNVLMTTARLQAQEVIALNQTLRRRSSCRRPRACSRADPGALRRPGRRRQPLPASPGAAVGAGRSR